MAKTRKNNILKTVSKTSNKVLPVVDKGLKTIGTTAKDVASSSLPIIEKGVSIVYETMATGFNLGVKGVNSVSKGMAKSKRSKFHKKSGRKYKTRGHKTRGHKSRY
jgi:hypothetical protein